MKSVYFAYIQSLLEGGVISWGGTYMPLLKP